MVEIPHVIPSEAVLIPTATSGVATERRKAEGAGAEGQTEGIASELIPDLRETEGAAKLQRRATEDDLPLVISADGDRVVVQKWARKRALGYLTVDPRPGLH